MLSDYSLYSCTSSIWSIILCIFASVLNTNCDIGNEFDDLKIERLVCGSKGLSWLVFYPYLLLMPLIYICSVHNTDRWTNDFHFVVTADTSVGSAHIVVAPLCVQLCHLSFADDLAVVVGVIAMPWKATLENSGKS